MKIAIIADSLDDQYAGLYTYAKYFIRALLQGGAQHSYVFVHVRHNDFFQGLDEMIVPHYPAIPGYGFFRKFIILPRLLRKRHIDLVHDLSHLAPFLFRGTELYKKILTVHDCTPLLFPRLHPWKSVLFHRLLFPRILKHADAIVAVSADTKNDLITLFPFLKAKTHSIPSGIRQQIVQTESPCRQPYILFVGTWEPRKNLHLLLNAFTLLKRQYDIPHQLVIIGKKGWKYENLEKQINTSPFRQEIQVLGYVAEDKMSAYYRFAEVLVYPAFYEGFGFPPLEAMVQGCPVVASNTAGIRSISADGALLFDGKTVEDLAQSIYTVLMNPAVRARLVQKGKQTAARYAWEKTIQETLLIYSHMGP